MYVASERERESESCKENVHDNESMRKLSSEIESVVTERMFSSGIWIFLFVLYSYECILVIMGELNILLALVIIVNIVAYVTGFISI